MTTYLPGIDVYAGDNGVKPIDWAKVCGADFPFAFLKATEGHTLTDSAYYQNRLASRDAGLLSGPYHYFLPGGTAALQATHFCNTVMAGGMHPDDLPRGRTDWQFWQRSETGLVPGIAGACAITVFHRPTLADLQAWIAAP
jgi:GH25 family lysozyme M1 (1,4-beta-N-acetylmuramidase)